MASNSEDTARRRPTQKRAREKYKSILRACGEVLREEGFERTTTAKVAARAGVGKGALYQYFANREELVTALVESQFDRVLTRTIDAKQARGDDRPLETARALLQMNVEFWLENRKLLNVILNEVPGVFDLPGIRRLEERLTHFTNSLVAVDPAVDRPAEIDRKLYVLRNAIAGFVLRLALVEPIDATVEEITDELMTMLQGYLEGSGLGRRLSRSERRFA